MRKILKVAQREYLETVKTKTFVASVVFVPVMVGGIILFTSHVAESGPGSQPPRKVVLVDLTEELAEEIRTAFEAYSNSHPGGQIVLEQLLGKPGPEDFGRRQKDRVQRGELDAYVVVDRDILDGAGRVGVYTGIPKAADFRFVDGIASVMNRAVVSRRCQLKNLSPALLAEVRRRVSVDQITVGGARDSQQKRVREKERIVSAIVPFFFMFLMFMGIFGMGQHMLTNIIEEKSSRIIEVLLSALSPFQLMAGKITGLAGIGLTVICLWAGAAYLAAWRKGLDLEISVTLLACFVVYYVLGFLLFTSILAGIGSICNTIKEAQSLMMPVNLVFVLPMVAWFSMVDSPNAGLARVLSLVPPLSPMVMVLRISASPNVPAIEIVASLLLLAACVPAVVWAAAKTFRTGVLMYGKRPRLREVGRWLLQS